jgi:hypothetical protein
VLPVLTVVAASGLNARCNGDPTLAERMRVRGRPRTWLKCGSRMISGSLSRRPPLSHLDQRPNASTHRGHRRCAFRAGVDAACDLWPPLHSALGGFC